MNKEPPQGIFISKFNAKTAPHNEAIKRAIETGKVPYTLNRGMYDRKVGNEMVYGYNTLLPTFAGANLDQWLSLRTTPNGSPTTITDLGYGTGQFLLDMAGRNLKCTGYGRSEYTKLESSEAGITPTHDLLQQQPNITLVEGDLPFDNSQIPTDSQDIIVANNVFLYLSPETQVQTIRNIISALKKGGICLLNQIRIEDPDIVSTLLEAGMSPEDFEIKESSNQDIGKTLAFRKAVNS